MENTPFLTASSENAFKMIAIFQESEMLKRIPLEDYVQHADALALYKKTVLAEDAVSSEEEGGRGRESDPTCWADVIEEELEDERATNADALQAVLQQAQEVQATELQDPLGLVVMRENPKESDGLTRKTKGWSRIKRGFKSVHPDTGLSSSDASTGSVLPDANAFDPVLFLTEVHQRTPFADLARGLASLQQEQGGRSQQMKALVRQRFTLFCTCKETVDLIHSHVRFRLIDAYK
jgi:hypothetical protein